MNCDELDWEKPTSIEVRLLIGGGEHDIIDHAVVTCGGECRDGSTHSFHQTVEFNTHLYLN